MTKQLPNRLRNNLLATLFTLITLVVMFWLTGCATTELTYDPNGKTTWKSTTFLKNVKDADVQWGSMHARLGSSLGDHQTVGAVTGSLMQTVATTGQITMMGGDLVDTLGRPRPATAGEMAAQYEMIQRMDNNVAAPYVDTGLMPGSSSMREDDLFKAGVAEGRKQQSKLFNRDGAGNVWIDGKINPTLPLKPDNQ